MSIEGKPFMLDSSALWNASALSCVQSRAVRIRYGDDTESTLTCPAAMPELPIKRFVRLRPNALARLGLGG